VLLFIWKSHTASKGAQSQAELFDEINTLNSLPYCDLDIQSRDLTKSLFKTETYKLVYRVSVYGDHVNQFIL
jgi:hypothetical protein